MMALSGKKLWMYCKLLLLAWLAASEAVAQTTGGTIAQAPALKPAPLSVFDNGFTQYPSLEPLSVIDVTFSGAALFDAIKLGLKDPSWNCTSSKIYVVQEVDKNLKPLHAVNILRVIVPLDTLHTKKPYANCDGFGNPGDISMVLDLGPQFSKLDMMQVSMYADEKHTKLIAQSDGKLTLGTGAPFSFTATPQTAPGEALNNGKTRDTGQLSVAIGDTDLFPNEVANVYAKSTDLFSTDEKDTKSAFSVTFGAQRGLLPKWYTPLSLGETIQGNQIASNLSVVTSLGFTTLVPWSWTKPIFNNNAISAPMPPDVTVANSYTRRIHQLVTAKTPLLSQNDYSLNPSMSWSSITLPVSCKLFAWLNKAPGAGTGPNCIGFAVDLGLWYLPLDLTSAKTQKVEGYGDGSILLPLEGFGFASKIFPYITTNDPTKVQIQIKYTDSVNAANNYARTRGWTYGLQVLK